MSCFGGPPLEALFRARRENKEKNRTHVDRAEPAPLPCLFLPAHARLSGRHALYALTRRLLERSRALRRVTCTHSAETGEQT